MQYRRLCVSAWALLTYGKYWWRQNNSALLSLRLRTAAHVLATADLCACCKLSGSVSCGTGSRAVFMLNLIQLSSMQKLQCRSMHMELAPHCFCCERIYGQCYVTVWSGRQILDMTRHDITRHGMTWHYTARHDITQHGITSHSMVLHAILTSSHDFNLSGGVQVYPAFS